MSSERPQSNQGPVSFLLIMMLLASHLALAPPASAKRNPSRSPSRSALAYTPGATWGPSGGGITSRLGVTPAAIYLIDPSSALGGPGRLVGDPRRYWSFDSRVSPRGNLIAFSGRTGEYASMEGAGGEGVGVMDLNGRVLTFIYGGSTFAWSPGGRWLAVVVNKHISSRSTPGLALWNARTHSDRRFHEHPSRVGWVSEDALLLQLEDQVDVLNPQTGSRTRTPHHGTVVSPDGLYSMWPGEGGENTKVIDDATGEDITSRLFGPMERKGLRQIRSAFWIRGDGAEHLMCVSGSDNVYGEHPRCRTGIVDAATGEMIVVFPGEAIGPTADGRTTVVLRHELGALQAVSFEEMLRDTAPEGQFY